MRQLDANVLLEDGERETEVARRGGLEMHVSEDVERGLDMTRGKRRSEGWHLRRCKPHGPCSFGGGACRGRLSPLS